MPIWINDRRTWSQVILSHYWLVASIISSKYIQLDKIRAIESIIKQYSQLKLTTFWLCQTRPTKKIHFSVILFYNSDFITCFLFILDVVGCIINCLFFQNLCNSFCLNVLVWIHCSSSNQCQWILSHLYKRFTNHKSVCVCVVWIYSL